MKKTSIKKRSQSHRSSQSKQPLFMGLGFYGVLSLLVFKGSIGWHVLGWYVVIGVLTYAVYAKDKQAAQQHNWRTPESTLHVLSLLGGWVGAMIAQHQLRHKTQKPKFRLRYYLTVLINLAGLLYLISGGDLSRL